MNAGPATRGHPVHGTDATTPVGFYSASDAEERSWAAGVAASSPLTNAGASESFGGVHAGKAHCDNSGESGNAVGRARALVGGRLALAGPVAQATRYALVLAAPALVLEEGCHSLGFLLAPRLDKQCSCSRPSRAS